MAFPVLVFITVKKLICGQKRTIDWKNYLGHIRLPNQDLVLRYTRKNNYKVDELKENFSQPLFCQLRPSNYIAKAIRGY